MTSVIFNVAARTLSPVFALLSLFVLYRGHNLPGGGFIGGLLAAIAVVLLILAYGPEAVRRRWWFQPVQFMTVGLLVALASGALALVAGQPFFEGLWLPTFSLPLLGTVHLGTPLIFDIGVYLVVVGFTAQAIVELSEAR
ncbi:MAG: MnhB domain-containing protein [Opitutales bacterium]